MRAARERGPGGGRKKEGWARVLWTTLASIGFGVAIGAGESRADRQVVLPNGLA